jgi:hypothetical protein
VCHLRHIVEGGHCSRCTLKHHCHGVIEIKSTLSISSHFVNPSSQFFCRTNQNIVDIENRAVVTKQQSLWRDIAKALQRVQREFKVEIGWWRRRTYISGFGDVDSGSIARVEIATIGVDESEVM